MTRIHESPGSARRSNISLVVLIAVFFYGLWELWHAATVTNDTTAYLFGVIFVGGALYGARVTLAEARDLVNTFDLDPETGKTLISLWRPFHMKRIETSIDRVTDWRHWVQTGPRKQLSHYLLARTPFHDGMLRFAMQPGMEIKDEFRRIAPKAIKEFERETGIVVEKR